MSIFRCVGQFFIPFLSILASSLGAQINFKHLSSIDGLSDSYVNCIIKDSEGFIWIGTQNGLNKYDGQEITHFKAGDFNAKGLRGNHITSIVQDVYGGIWIGSLDGGLSRYDIRTGDFKNYKAGSYQFPNDNISDLAVRNSDLWIAHQNLGVSRWDLDGECIISSPFDSISHISINCIEVYDSLIIAGTISKSLAINYGDHLKLLLNDKTFPYPAHSINAVFRDNNKNYWVAAWDNALHYFDSKLEKHQYFLLPGNDKIQYSDEEILAINEDNSG